MPKHWSGRQLDLLQAHWGEPDLSLRDIAAAINAQTGARFSRNAIAGQAKRLGLPLRRAPNRTERAACRLGAAGHQDRRGQSAAAQRHAPSFPCRTRSRRRMHPRISA